jgi:hypothetical protein
LSVASNASDFRRFALLLPSLPLAKLIRQFFDPGNGGAQRRQESGKIGRRSSEIAL